MADEENEEVENEENEENEVEEGGSKKKLIIIAVAALVLLLGAGGGIFFFLSGDDDAGGKEVATEVAEGEDGEAAEGGEAPEGEEAPEGGEAGAEGTAEAGAEGDGKEKKEEVKIDFGETYQMKTFNLNLGNALENRFVRMEVTLEYSGGGSHKQEIEKRLPQLRDAVISVVSRKTREFLLAPDGKDALRKEILIRINRYMKQKIDAVFITDILIE